MHQTPDVIREVGLSAQRDNHFGQKLNELPVEIEQRGGVGGGRLAIHRGSLAKSGILASLIAESICIPATQADAA